MKYVANINAKDFSDLLPSTKVLHSLFLHYFCQGAQGKQCLPVEAVCIPFVCEHQAGFEGETDPAQQPGFSLFFCPDFYVEFGGLYLSSLSSECGFRKE